MKLSELRYGWVLPISSRGLMSGLLISGLVLSAPATYGEMTTMNKESEQLLQALYDGTPTPPPYRVNHAKGVLLAGYFVATPQAAALSIAPHFQGGPVPVQVRFSDFTGIPDIADNAEQANPRGMAIRFLLSGGASTDIVAHSVNGFPARTPAEFLEFLKAANQAKQHPDRFKQFLASHDAARRFVALPLATPRSYVTERYFALHAFKFVGKSGNMTVGRYILEPEHQAAHYSKQEAATLSGDFLQRDIRIRVTKAEARMKLVLQLADPADRLDDISVGWPEYRPQIVLGEIVLTSVNDDAMMQQNLAFDPAHLTVGIESAGDPMLSVREAVYRRSFKRRNPQK